MGPAIGRRTILPVLRPIPRVRHRARVGSSGVVPGTDGGSNLRSAKCAKHPPVRNYNIGFRVGFQAVQPDTANPELELFGGAAITREAGQAWAEPGVEAHDVRDGNITDQIVVTGTVDMNSNGYYILTYSVAGCRGQYRHRQPNGHGGGQPLGGPECHRGDGYALGARQAPLPWVVRRRKRVEEPIETEHNVSLTKGFYLGKYEVTQAQYEAVMTGSNPINLTRQLARQPGPPGGKSNLGGCPGFPDSLNAQQGRPITRWLGLCVSHRIPMGICLPCRNDHGLLMGATIASSNANYNWDGGANDGSDFKQTRDVGQYAANPWGFFDMHGNVWEWTADWYQAAYPTGNPVVDPTGPASGSDRVRRGGSWYDGGTSLRSAERAAAPPGYRLQQPRLPCWFPKKPVMKERGKSWPEAEPGQTNRARD